MSSVGQWEECGVRIRAKLEPFLGDCTLNMTQVCPPGLDSSVAMLRGGGTFKGWSLAGGSKGY